MVYREPDRCPACGQIADKEALECDSCGSGAALVCPGCGAPAQPDYKHCSACGRPLKPDETPLSYQELRTAYDQYQKQLIEYARDLTKLYMVQHRLERYLPNGLLEKALVLGSEVASERRYMTVLFADMVEYTNLSADMDGEEIFAMMNDYFRILVEQVYKFGGSIDKFIGDGIMVLFGVPTPCEDGPERAVRAALAMVEAVARFGQEMLPELGKPLRLRAGITSGHMVAGKVGAKGRHAYTVMGKSVNIAYRLQGAAKPGTILVNDEVYRQTRHLFDYKILPPTHVKGIEEPVPVFEVVGPIGTSS